MDNELNHSDFQSRNPIPLNNFADLRANNCLYVDKTDLIFKLAVNKKPRFLSRPRRFGKTTIVSTLKELFAHGVDPYDGHDSYFKGLKIEKLWTDTKKYSIIHLDFSSIYSNYNTPYNFEKGLCLKLLNIAQQLGLQLFIDENDKYNIGIVFSSLLESAQDNSLVLLIDEYDAPLTENIDLSLNKNNDFEYITNIMRKFYLNIKVYLVKFRCVFITGITRYKDTSIFSNGSVVQDISLDPDYATICGYTRDEILFYFKDLVTYAVTQQKHIEENRVTANDCNELLDELAKWYDGYIFTDFKEIKVFSTWSVLSFLLNPKLGFKSFWYDSGGEPNVIRKNLLNYQIAQKLDIQNLNNLMQERIIAKRSSFLYPTSLESMDLNVLFYQTGYLTFAKVPVISGNDYLLKIPNLEIKEALLYLISKKIFIKINGETVFNLHRDNFIKAILNQDEKSLLDTLNLVLNTVCYDNYPIVNESTLASILGVFVWSCVNTIRKENHERFGRPDLEFDFGNLTIVFEYKFIPSPNKTISTQDLNDKLIDKTLEGALSQIKNKDYGKTLNAKEQIWAVALVYCEKSRKLERVKGFKIQLKA